MNTDEVLNHFTTFICKHRNSDLFTCEDMFSRESSAGISLVFILIVFFQFLINQRLSFL